MRYSLFLLLLCLLPLADLPAQTEPEAVLVLEQEGKEDRYFRADKPVYYLLESERGFFSGYLRYASDSTLIIDTKEVEIDDIKELKGEVRPNRKDQLAKKFAFIFMGIGLLGTAFLYFLTTTVSTQYLFLLISFAPYLILVPLLILLFSLKIKKRFVKGKRMKLRLDYIE